MTNTPSKILDYYDFLLREEENQFFKHTGTPSFHLLVKSKMDTDTEYKQIPHGKGGCILKLGFEEKTFVFDNLYDMLIPAIGDDKIIQKWQDKKQAENNIAALSQRYLNSKDIILSQSIMDAEKDDLIYILKEEEKEEYIPFIEKVFKTEGISEIIAREANDAFLYIMKEDNIVHFIISKKEKSKDTILVDVFEHYGYIDKLVETNQKKYAINQYPYLGEVD